MDPLAPPRSPSDFPWSAVLLSLLLHAMLLSAIALLPGLPPVPEPSRISMRLLPAPVVSTEIAPPQAPQPEPAPVPDAEPDPPLSEPPDPAAPEPAPDDNALADRSDEPAERAEPLPGTRKGISARLLEQVADRLQSPAPDPEPGLPWTGTGEAVPGLPGSRGWLSGFVGSVRPGSQRWQASDGSQRARHVLADGTVVCTQRRAPTIDEIMNPWKSLAVTLVSVCGREAPPPPDFSDPRVQPPPRRVSDRPELPAGAESTDG